MADTDIFAVLPINDNLVYVDHGGYFDEVRGYAWARDDKGYVKDKIMGSKGYIDDPAGGSIDMSIIGRKGDTIKLKDLGVAFQFADDINTVVDMAKQFFTLDTSDLEDTVVFSLDTQVAGQFNARVDCPTKCFPRLGTNFIDLSDPDYKDKERERSTDFINDTLIPVLVEYSHLIGKRVKLEIYFAKADYPFWENDWETHHDESNAKIHHLEELFLPRLRRYMNEALDKELDDEKKSEQEHKEYLERKAKLKEKYKSRFDLDPNLM